MEELLLNGRYWLLRDDYEEPVEVTGHQVLAMIREGLPATYWPVAARD